MKVWLKKLVVPINDKRDSIILLNHSYERLGNGRYIPLKRLDGISRALPPDCVMHFEDNLMVLTGSTFQYKFRTFSQQDVLTALAVVEAAIT